MLAQLFDSACRLSPSIRRFLTRCLFQYMSLLDKEALMIFMNLGYARTEPDEELQVALIDDDPANRYCIQMYHHVVSSIDLNGRDVLEIGSGRGGGASYITQYLHPKSMTGVDISERAIAFCNRYHCVENLRFLHGDAEALPFGDNTFDVIVNIESSHGYGHMDTFLREVFRVLRPHGYFLFADFRDRDTVDTLRKELLNSGLTMMKEECITKHVLQALDLDNERKLKLIQDKVPRIMHKVFLSFAAIQGSKMYEALRTGEKDYRYFILFK